jgi:hypothetical protein
MRRTIFMALLAALLLVPAAAHAAADPIEILRDCQDDDVLQGDYTAAELRKARSELPTDIDEYSPCRDVLSRAIAAKTSTAKNNDSGGSTAGGSVGGGGTTGGSVGGSTSTSVPTPEETAKQEQEQAILSAPSSPEDAKAVYSAAEAGDRTVLTDANPKSPGAERLAANVGRNGIPGAMLVVLVLLGAALLAAGLPLIRRHRAVSRPAP